MSARLELNNTTGGYDYVYRMNGNVVARTPAKRVDCPHCDGGTYQHRTTPWNSRERICDECGGSGEQWVEVEEDDAAELPQAVASR